jgi:hypothetical protein
VPLLNIVYNPNSPQSSQVCSNDHPAGTDDLDRKRERERERERIASMINKFSHNDPPAFDCILQELIDRPPPIAIINLKIHALS